MRMDMRSPGVDVVARCKVLLLLLDFLTLRFYGILSIFPSPNGVSSRGVQDRGLGGSSDVRSFDPVVGRAVHVNVKAVVIQHWGKKRQPNTESLGFFARPLVSVKMIYRCPALIGSLVIRKQRTGSSLTR